MKYKILINGTCGEAKYFAIKEEAKAFWQEKIDEFDHDLLNDYIWGDADLDEIPDSAQFMGEDPYDFMPTVERSIIDFDNLYIWVQPVDGESKDYSIAKNQIEWIEDYDFEEGEEYLVVSEYMKGTIFGAEIELPDGELFDKDKLKFFACIDPNKESVFSGMSYDEIELENTELDLIGKGRNAYIIEK
jgi:hypothetical protein